VYTLHIANKNYSSWSLRPWVLMRERGIAFEERLTPFNDGLNGSDFSTFSPSGLVPCLVDGETTVWDSLAITEYLAEKHPGVWPKDAAARAWARCAAAEMHSGFGALRNTCSMNVGVVVALQAQSPALEKNIARLDALWTQGFKRFGGPFLAGAEFTAVDAFYVPVAFRVRGYGLQLSAPSMAYVERLLALDSVRAWEAAALAETWREAGHEAEMLQVGTIVSDRRAGA